MNKKEMKQRKSRRYVVAEEVNQSDFSLVAMDQQQITKI